MLFSTHILPDIERVCDQIGLLHGGGLRLSGRLEEIRQLHAKSGFSVEFAEAIEAERFRNAFPDGEFASATHLLYPKGTREDMTRALALLGSMHLCPLRVEQNEPSLESLFLEAAGT